MKQVTRESNNESVTRGGGVACKRRSRIKLEWVMKWVVGKEKSGGTRGGGLVLVR